MWQWIGKRMGITPELLERSRHMAQVAEERARQEPHLVMRQVIVLEPRQRCIDWYNQWSKDGKDHHDATLPADRVRFLRAYLAPSDLEERELARYIAERRSQFLMDFLHGFAPRSRWPWTPTEAEFDDWYGVTAVPMVWDLVDGPIGKEPDVATVLMRDF